jgi:hypothetical protein
VRALARAGSLVPLDPGAESVIERAIRAGVEGSWTPSTESSTPDPAAAHPSTPAPCGGAPALVRQRPDRHLVVAVPPRGVRLWTTPQVSRSPLGGVPALVVLC